MATFGIKSINYVIGGDTEKIINMDLFTDDKNVDKTYQLNKTFFTDEAKEPSDGSISASCNTHRMFVKNEDTPPEIMFNALFDFKDVAVKSDFYKSDKTAVFGPKLEYDPLGFVQGINGNAYGATDSEADSSIIAYTNLNDTRPARLNGDSNSVAWQYKLQSPGDLTYTYAKKSDLQIIETKYKDGESFEETREPETLLEYLESYGELSSTIGIEFLLNPKYNNLGLKRTFLYNIFVSNKKSLSSIWNEFNNGNVFGNVFLGKNFYDSKYSTALSSVNSTTSYPVRKYVKIGETGGWPFLVYYDKYSWNNNSGSEYAAEDGKTIRPGEIELNSNGRKYQHVETVKSISRFMNRGNHKSNLYSIRLNLKLNEMIAQAKQKDPDHAQELDTLLETAKLDIKNSIRRISSNLAPAHTQLFKVYIDNE